MSTLNNPDHKAGLESYHAAVLRALNSPTETAYTPHTPEPPLGQPTLAGPAHTKLSTMLARHLLYGLTSRGRRAVPNFYSRARPHFGQHPRSAAQAIRCSVLNVASVLCWPIARRIAQLQRALSAPCQSADASAPADLCHNQRTGKSQMELPRPVGSYAKPAAASDQSSSSATLTP